MSILRERPSSLTAIGSLAYRTGRLELDRDPDWFYMTPVTPLPEPDDYITDFITLGLYVPFEDPWFNDDSEPTAFASGYRLREGKPELRLCCTGGENDPGSAAGSLIATLPADFCPSYFHHLTVRLGTRGLGAVDVYKTGEIVFAARIVG